MHDKTKQQVRKRKRKRKKTNNEIRKQGRKLIIKWSKQMHRQASMKANSK